MMFLLVIALTCSISLADNDNNTNNEHQEAQKVAPEQYVGECGIFNDSVERPTGRRADRYGIAACRLLPRQDWPSHHLPSDRDAALREPRGRGRKRDDRP